MRRLISKMLAAISIVAVAVIAYGHIAGALSFNLTGTVRDPANNSVSGAYVYATAPNSAGMVYGPVVTNASGLYTLPIANAGNYDIHFVPPSGKVWSEMVESNIALSTAQVLNKNFTATQVNTLSGTLRTSDGTPIPYATVKLGSYQTSTSSTGTYSLSVPAASYILSVSGGDTAVAGLYSFTLQQATAGINLSYGNQTLDLTIKMVHADVTPLQNNGAPVGGKVLARATSGVTSLYPGDPGTNITLAWSDDVTIDSTYSFTPGTLYTISGATFTAAGLESSSYMTSMCKINSTSGTYDCLRTPLTIRDNTSLQIPSTDAAVRTFSGTLVDASSNPISGATITLVKYNDQSVTVQTDANGAFSMKAMPKKYTMKVYIPASAGVGLTGISLSQSTANPPIDLTAADKTLNLQLPNTTITVNALDIYGQPAYYAPVTAHSNTGTAYLYSGDPGFSFEIYPYTQYTTGSDNVVTLSTLVGATYIAKGLNTTILGSGSDTICVKPMASQNWNCLTSPLAISGATTINVGQ